MLGLVEKYNRAEFEISIVNQGIMCPTSRVESLANIPSVSIRTASKQSSILHG